MAMNVLQSPSRPGLGKVSGFFWRNPGLGLFLLLLGPLMWFGIVYFGSLRRDFILLTISPCR